jgi:hypothetical protein
MNSLIKDDTELFKQFGDNESFRRWLLEMRSRTTHLRQTRRRLARMEWAARRSAQLVKR